MTPLFTEPAPRVFWTPPGEPFAEALAAGLLDRLRGAPPEALARVAVTLNTRRARRALVEAFERAADARGAAACLLPRLATLDEIGDDPEDAGLPPAADPRRRALALTRLVRGFLAAAPEHGPPAAAPALAAALAGLVDECAREGVALDRLDDAAPVEHAAHWEVTRRVVALARDAWPAIREADQPGALDPEARRRLAVDRRLARWAAAPPEGPVLAAGSTGSVGVTAMLLRAVATLPQGAVVLPGYDPDLAAEVWEAIGEQHPYAGFRRLLDQLGLGPRDPRPWLADRPGPRPARRRLIGQALRPAPVTDGWLDALPALAREAAEATAGLTLVEAPDPRREALAVAVAMRGAIAGGRRAALVTPDRGLARRVAAALARWGIEADDSGGTPLALTPPGVFLRLVAAILYGPWDPVGLLALLQHPLCAAGEGRDAHRRAVRRLEVKARRAGAGLGSLAEARALAATLGDRAAPATAALAALAAPDGPAPLDALAAAHLAAAEALAGPALWGKAAGEAVRAAAEGFRAAAAVYGPCPREDYVGLFAAALDGEVREEAFRPDPRAAIWGPLEARMQSADLLILGGLVEGVWPATPAPDPWLSRPMRAALGLPPPERRLGLAAHDVLQAACAPEVVLSRPLRAEGAPTTPSRWLARLTTLLDGADPAALAAMRARGRALLAWAATLDRPGDAPAPAPRPAPRPPVAARPRRLSATDVERLIRDPYAIYAKRVLGLRRLDPLDAGPDAAERGTLLHAVMARYAALAADPGADPAEALARAAAETLDASPAPVALRRLWRARFDRLAPAFLADERARRAAGAIVATERRGLREGPLPGFVLTAVADRIDGRADGTLAIYDYKSGEIPTPKQVERFAKQLPLEAAIAEVGGFEGVPAAKVAELAFISLSGGTVGGAARALEGDPAEEAAKAWEGLARLLAAYDDAATPYLARARPKLLTYASDYDHLSRYGEWEDGA